MVMELLKTETKEAHQQLEKLLIPYIKQANTTDDYITLLELFYGYMMPVEKLIDAHVITDKIPFYNNRRKVECLLNDLKYWGYSGMPLFSDELPLISSHNQALGAMYVFEGSTLGGAIIKKILMANLHQQSNGGFSFYNGYGDATKLMWSTFTDALNNENFSGEEQNEIVEAANDTFIKFKNWAAKALLYVDAEEKL